jgi:hypothetical protein
LWLRPGACPRVEHLKGFGICLFSPYIMIKDVMFQESEGSLLSKTHA